MLETISFSFHFIQPRQATGSLAFAPKRQNPSLTEFTAIESIIEHGESTNKHSRNASTKICTVQPLQKRYNSNTTKANTFPQHKTDQERRLENGESNRPD